MKHITDFVQNNAKSEIVKVDQTLIVKDLAANLVETVPIGTADDSVNLTLSI